MRLIGCRLNDLAYRRDNQTIQVLSFLERKISNAVSQRTKKNYIKVTKNVVLEGSLRK